MLLKKEVILWDIVVIFVRQVFYISKIKSDDNDDDNDNDDYNYCKEIDFTEGIIIIDLRIFEYLLVCI